HSPLDEFFNVGRVSNIPPVNVSETDGEYTLCIATPGLGKADINLEIQDDMLTISAEKEHKGEKNGRYNRREYNFMSWSRSFMLTENANISKIDAKHENGELILKIPKTEVIHSGNSRKIAIH